VKKNENKTYHLIEVCKEKQAKLDNSISFQSTFKKHSNIRGEGEGLKKIYKYLICNLYIQTDSFEHYSL